MDRSARIARLADARLYFICDARPGGRALTEVLGPALDGGVDLFQLRDKGATQDELLAAAAVARELCRQAGALFFVNDDPGLAARTGADGVHVGQDDMTVQAAREHVGADLLIGRSTHSPAQIEQAADADLIGVGPVHATPTKPGRAPVGLELVKYAAGHASSPWFAIGGLDATNVGAVVAAGATRIAVVRAIADAPDPHAAAYRLRAMLPDTIVPHGPAQPAS